MAEILMKYRVEKCTHSDPKVQREHCGNCHTCASWLTGCAEYHTSERGDCSCADFKYVYFFDTISQCEMSEVTDANNPWLNCMKVKINGETYDCVKVVLNGELIYEQDEDGKRI